MVALLLSMLGILILIAFLIWIIESAPFLSDTMKPFIRWAAIAIGGFILIIMLLRILGVETPFNVR